MKSLYLALALLLGCALPALSQNVRVDGVVQSAHGPAPNVFIAVCSQPANLSVTPCTTRVALCSSLTDVVCTSPNPVTSDGLGNYFFYIPAGGTYTYQFYGTGLQTRSFVDQQPGSATSTGGVLLAPSTDQTIVGSHQLINQGTEQTGFPFSSFDADIQAFALNPSTGQVAVSGQTSGAGNIGIQGIQTGGGGGSGVFGLGEGLNSATFGGFFANFANVTSGTPYVGTGQFGQINLTVTGALAEDVGANAGEAKIYGGIVRSLSSYITAGNQDNAGGTGGVATNSYGYNVQQAMNIGTPGATINAAFHANDQGSGANNYGILLDGVTHNDLGAGITKVGYGATKTGPWIDPKAWGCANDGTTDDTTCFQNAVNYAVANHGAVICSGSYKLDRVQVSTNTWIQGTNNSNERGCQIVVKTDGAFVSANPTSYLGSVTIHNIKFLNGSNPIDLALINGADIRDVDFLNQTGCGVVIVDGERHTLWGLQATHTGADGVATLCTGDKSKSLFSGVLGAGPFGIARNNIKDLRELGNLNGGTHFSQYLWWGGQGVGGNISTTTVENTICFFSCTAGYIWMDAMTYSSMNDLDMDNISTVGSPASVGLYITNGMTGSWISSFNPAFNTNHIVTQMKIANLGDSTISNSKFSGDNISTFGLYIGGGASAGGQLFAIEGPVFVNGANSNNTKNEISVSGSQITTTNLGAGAILSDINNLGAEVTLLGNAINTTPATSTFRVHRFLSGGQPGTFSDDFVSGPTTFTLSRNLVMDNSSGTAQYENGIVSTWYSDAGSTTKAFINGSNGQLSLPTTGSASTPLIQLGTTAGTGFFQRTGGEIDVTSASTAQFDFSGNYLSGASGNLYCFLNGAVGGSSDTCFSRDAAGVFDVGTGAAANKDGAMRMTRIQLVAVAFSTLPACAAGTEGSQQAVNDSTTATWGATITGSSTNHVLAYCDGTNWTVAGK